MKQATLDKLQLAARDGQCRLFYLDEAGICAAPPVQRSWSPRGLPHAIEPNSHCRRSIIGALDFGKNALIHASHTRTVKALHVVEFIEALLQQGDGKPTVIVLDNASIHHSIDQATLDRWFIEHKTLLFYLPPYSPELNLIEIVWKHSKYHWRRFGLCRDKVGKARKLCRGKGSLHEQRIELLGGSSRDAISFHLPFPDHMHRFDA